MNILIEKIIKKEIVNLWDEVNRRKQSQLYLEDIPRLHEDIEILTNFLLE